MAVLPAIELNTIAIVLKDLWKVVDQESQKTFFFGWFEGRIVGASQVFQRLKYLPDSAAAFHESVLDMVVATPRQGPSIVARLGGSFRKRWCEDWRWCED